MAKPKMSLIGDKEIILTINEAYVEYGAKAFVGNKDISDRIKIKGYVDTKKAGTYIITYNIKFNHSYSKITRVVKVSKQSKPKKSTIYLTFDDGPSSITPKLLDILKEENVKATFFVINWSSSYDYVLKRMVNEGHTIGLHSYTHKYSTNYSSIEDYFNELELIKNKVKKVTGVDSKIIRFIGGSSNTASRFNPGIMTRLTKEVTKRGYYYFDWNISSGDTGNISSKRIYRNVKRSLDDYPTYIILMHDYEGNNITVRALRNIIKYGKEHGYSFERITEKTPPTNHRVKN
jgi:peptidoglycan/xylan/chitin deacetylase (PgdA/CDA1 family)